MAKTDRQDRVQPPIQPASGSLTRMMFWLGGLSVIYVVFIIFAPIDSWFPAATSQARSVDNLFRFMLATSGVIFIYVEGLLVVFIVQYRQRKDDPENMLGVQLHGNTRLEIIWSAGPALLITLLAVLSFIVWQDMHQIQPNELDLEVHGFQYGWSFSLPQYGISNVSTVTIPVNQNVHVVEHSADVIHSFWVPQFRAKQDAVPGLLTEERFRTVETGTFPVICTELCGPGHSSMVSSITVATQSNFVAWLKAHGATSLPSSASAALVTHHA